MKNLGMAICLMAFLACKQEGADMLIHHANIYTVDSNFTTAEAMAIKDGLILELGSNAAMMEKYGNAKEHLDAKGAPVYPGFMDAHAHFVGYANALYSANLVGAKSWEEVVDRVKAFAAKHPDLSWITGAGWDQNLWPNKQFPNNQLLNEAFPNLPVVLQRIDGHASLANAKALELAGVKAGQNLVGGLVVLEQGKLTGLLVDNAVNLVDSKIPAPNAEQFVERLLAAEKNCFAQGLTTITDCGLDYETVDVIKVMQDADKLKMRLAVMLSDNPSNLNKYLPIGPAHHDRLHVIGFKVYADGALGSRGACLSRPYSDQLNWAGFLLSKQYHYDSLANVLSSTKFQMCTHAIGDSANRVILRIYHKYLQPGNDRRWRIEHAQVLGPDDFDLFGKASIVPSVQPTHANSDAAWATERLGPVRIKTAYAFQQLLKQNNWLPLGTDFPVESISPMKTFLAAVDRNDGKGLTREQAIRGMTIWAAKAAFLENTLGSLEKGKQADFILLNQDLMTVPANKILSVKVMATYSGGEKVF